MFKCTSLLQEVDSDAPTPRCKHLQYDPWHLEQVWVYSFNVQTILIARWSLGFQYCRYLTELTPPKEKDLGNVPFCSRT